MAAFGTLTLLMALIVATYGGVASVVGARRRSLRLIDSGRAAAYALAATLGLSSVAMVQAFVSGEYSIRYVQRYSDASSPLFYKITAYWGGLDGSILWWAFLLSVFSAIAIFVNRNRHKEIMPYVVATLMAICCFFLYVIVFHKNPFDTYLTTTPASGEGLNPILQNAYMITHPPSLYIGFVGMSIPFAFAMGALISGHLDDAWITAVRRWTLIAWFFLSMGLTLGMLWAYEELGWGGFWAWDPVENAGFLPWLTGTAFFHSTMIQERRGMLKIWNFTLVILTFFLTIVGTFLTRSGVVQSVHAFGQDTKLAVMFGGFMVVIVVVSFGFLIARSPELRSRAKLESPWSREAAFVVNNWILLFAAFFILFATLFPTLSEAVTGERINVSVPFYNKWMVPIGLALLFLTGVGPLIAWRKASTSHLRYQFLWPSLSAFSALVLCIVGGLASAWSAMVCFMLCAFVTGTITQEFIRGAGIRKRNTGSSAMSALLGMVLRGRRRYGGYIVHMGIVLIFIGFAGQAYKRDQEVSMATGQEVNFAGYQLKFAELIHDEDQQKEMITARMIVFRDGKQLTELRPARWYYAKRPTEPTTEVAIHHQPSEDLYVVLGNYDLSDGTVALHLVTNPLVNWIWIGFIMLAFGTGIAMLPESVTAPLAVRAGLTGGAAGGPRPATSGGLPRSTLIVLLAGLTLLRPGIAQADTRQADRKYLSAHIMCTCGCRRPLNDCGMPDCRGERDGLGLIDELLGQGKNREEVLGIFMARFGGQQILSVPVDKGFNRLAWALPYGLGLASAGVLAFGAYRFSKRAKAAAAARPAPEKVDPDLEDRLEDELSRIDS